LKEEALSTSEMERLLMQFKIRKAKELRFNREMERRTNFGRSSILTRRKMRSLRDFTQVSDFIATDHSILFQDSQ
jgi:hypothetical protein